MVNEERVYFQRLKIVLFFLLLAYFVLLVFLFNRQVVKHSYYLGLAKSQHFLAKEIPAHRGRIFASSIYQKEPFLLAGNQKLFSLNAVPRQIKDKEETAKKIAECSGLNFQDVFEAINNNKPYIPPLKRRLSYQEAKKIIQSHIEGVYLLPEDVRFYPHGSSLSYVLGYVDVEGKGNYGLEQYYNEELEGDSGRFLAERDVYGRYISISQETPPQDGKDLYLTIELPVQHKAEEIIKEAVETYGAESGQIIILNPKTGAVIALAASTGFNPENYAEEAKEKGIEVFYNPMVSKLFEPGSIFKVIPMAAALEEGLVEPYTKMNLGAYIEVQGHKIWTSDRKAHGEITMTQVLELSDNVGIVKVEQLLGKDKFFRFLTERFRLALPLGVDLPNEVFAQLPDPKHLKEIEGATMAFGQGVAVSPLQATSVFSAIANKGLLMRPYVVGKKVNSQGEEEVIRPQEIGRVISEQSAEKLKDMLVGVVEEGYGVLAKIDGYKIAGKTGTAQVPSPQGGYYPDKTIQSFAGFFPADNPQFVILVKLDYPTKSRWGSLSAAPTFRRMAQFLINYYQIPKEKETGGD